MSVKLIPKDQKGSVIKKEGDGKSKVQTAMELAKVKKAEKGTKLAVAVKRPPLQPNKSMTNVQQFRNDSTANLKTPITKLNKSDLADQDARNAAITAKEKSEKDARVSQERKRLIARKERGY